MKHNPKNTLKRLPIYLSYLKQLPESQTHISATAIAEGLKLGDVQVRKDLAAVSGAGRPKTGYDRIVLIDTLETFLGYGESKDAVIVGAGNLGVAFLEFERFADYGLNIAAAFDSDITKIGELPSGKRIYHVDEFADYCARTKVKIGIIAVPASEAVQVCDMMTECGIKAIWNFAPMYLSEPDGVRVHNENLAISLAILSGYLSDCEEE